MKFLVVHSAHSVLENLNSNAPYIAQLMTPLCTLVLLRSAAKSILYKLKRVPKAPEMLIYILYVFTQS